MLVMYVAWLLINRAPGPSVETESAATPEEPPSQNPRRVRWFDLVDTVNVDLFRDEHQDDVNDLIEDQERDRRLKGRVNWFWKLYYIMA